MPVTVIVGGQFGSEGKGKVAHHFAKLKNSSIAIRVGGTNSGHTVIDEEGRPIVFRMLPTAAILPECACVLSAGSYIDVDILANEIEVAKLHRDRLWIDPNAYIVGEGHKRQEQDWNLGQRIGSTQSGTGAAVVDRIMRLSTRHLAKNDDRLRQYVRPLAPFLRSELKRGSNVIIEGTQGFGLSLLHARDYPWATSRDTTAAAFVSEAGLSPLDVEAIILVIRAFPIRVAGDSGPLPEPIDWRIVADEGGWQTPVVEYTSVTKKIRRVARFHAAVVKGALDANSPTSVVLNHLDYVDASCHQTDGISYKIASFIRKVESEIDYPIQYLGLGPRSIVDRLALKYYAQARA